MVTHNQNFEVVRGDDLRQPFTVSLDASRVLDGTETWRLTIRRHYNTSQLAQLVSPAINGIEITAGTFQPVAIFTPARLPVAVFNAYGNKSTKYYYDLEMTKDGLVETVADGQVTVWPDVSQ